MCMSMRRFTQLTNAFSKKLENLQAAVALHFAHYNLIRLHKTLRVTPAMAANVTDRLWSLEEWWIGRLHKTEDDPEWKRSRNSLTSNIGGSFWPSGELRLPLLELGAHFLAYT